MLSFFGNIDVDVLFVDRDFSNFLLLNAMRFVAEVFGKFIDFEVLHGD